MSKLLVHEFTDIDGALRLDGVLTGTAGDVGPEAKFTVNAIEITKNSDENTIFLRAVLPAWVDIPAVLLDPTKPTRFKSAATLNAQLDMELRARVQESFRRLQTVEIKWADGAFLGPAGSITVQGEAKLALDVLLIEDEATAEAIVAAAFSACMEVSVSGQARTYDLVCRCKFKGKASLSLDLDDLNISLPDLELPQLNISPFLSLKVDVTSNLAGAFSTFDKNFTLTATWDPVTPVFVVRPDNGRLLFAVMKTTGNDLSGAVSASDLAELTAVVKHTSGFEAEISKATLAVHKSGVIATATVTLVNSKVVEITGTRNLGPLKISWEKVRLGAVATVATPNELRVSVAFERLMIHPLDDPAAVIAFRGEVELTPSGVAVVELAIVEPYPFVLVARTTAVLLRGARKIIEVLGQIKPKTNDDIEGLKKVLEALSKITAAVARAAVFIVRETGEALAEVAKLLAQAVAKVAELLLDLLKQLVSLADKAKPGQFDVDVELRIALEPLELRQIVLSLPGVVVDDDTAASALGFQLKMKAGWRPVLLLDFVTEPGAYLCAVRSKADAGQIPLASLSTDLWLKRPDGVIAAMHDASKDGMRPQGTEEPLLKVTAKATRADALLFVLAGLRGGQPVFFHKGKNKVTRIVKVPGGPDISVIDGIFTIEPLKRSDLDLSFDFQKERILPLLGMGEVGKEPAPSGDTFLERLKKSLGQVVTVKEVKDPKFVEPTENGKVVREIVGGLVLEIQAAGVRTEATLGVVLNVDNFEATFNTSSVFPIKSRRIEERALGLTWVVEQKMEAERQANAEVDMFTLGFAGAESGFELNKNVARMEIRFDGLSSDGEGVVFVVSEFHIGRGGLDVVAEVIERAVRLNGLDVPFRFKSGRIEIRGGKLVEAVVAGRGQLPPKLVGEANCTVLLAFELVNGEIGLKNGSKVELEKMGEPIVCHATRFTLTITHLEISFVREGGYHFYFLVTGSLRFIPKPGEFEDGLLKFLKDVEISLEQTPLTNDPRVLLKHVRFQKELKPKKTFPLFNIFTFELRGFGFHPASPKFEGKPAVNISGQIRFAEIGDVMQPKIDFHELWIAPPKEGESLPRIKAEGLAIDLQLAGSVKIRGAVLAVDRDTKTVEGREFAPDGYNTSGFLGEGAVDIPGLCAIEARMGFLEVERQDQPGDRKKAFFLFLQANKLAVEIPTPVWTFYLREAGFGFGYRYTLAGIKDAENARSAATLVRILDDVSKRQGDLSRFSAWRPDPEKDNFTLALRGAFQPYPAQKKFDENAEKKAVSPFFFDIVAALRSDFTFLLSARGWLGVNYATFLENKDNFRERPMFRGYLYISVPRSELLLRAIADSKGFVGEDWPELRSGVLREAVQSFDWTTTLYIRPGLFHYEMGWPDQLAVRLVDKPNMRVVVRGGMIFRAAEDGLLFGYNIGADAFMRFEGRIGGSIGVALVAELNAKFVARVLAFLAANFRDSLVYGLIALDARLTFSVEAWMDVDLGFTSFTIRIGFSFSVQFTAAVELAISPQGVGGRVEARIAVQVFGCSISVGIGFAFNQGRLDEARARVQRFMAMSITSEEPDAPPIFGATQGDKAIDKNAESAAAAHKAPPTPEMKPKGDGLKPDINRAKFGRDLKPTDFLLVLRHARVAPGGGPLDRDDMAYALFVPKEAESLNRAGFYAAPSQYENDAALLRSETLAVHRINSDKTFSDVQIWVPNKGFQPFKPKDMINARWNAPVPVPGGTKDTFTLAFLFDECFLSDTTWKNPGPVRRATDWREPLNLRFHKGHTVPESVGEVRKQERELQQKAHTAEAIAFPNDERAYQARSTVMTMFLDQFVSLAATGKRTDLQVETVLEAHVTDLGLVLFGPVAELEKLHGETLTKFDSKGEHDGSVAVLNPRATWFDRQDPILAADHQAVEADGIKHDWRLSIPGIDNPQQLLQHYEIVRTIEGFEFTPYTMNVKPAATMGERNETSGEVKLMAPDWQFIDTLAAETGVSAIMRRALLPAFGEGEGMEAAKAWIQTFPGNDVTLTYSITPVDTAGVRGLPRGFAIDIKRPQVPIRPAIAELRVVQTIPNIDTRKTSLERAVDPPDDLEVFFALNDRAWDDDSPVELQIGNVKYAVERIYRLLVDPEDIEPAGHYGSDATTSRLRGPGAFAATKTADELPFDISRKATVSFDGAARNAIREIEPELEERKKLPRWARLAETNLPSADQPAFDKTTAARFRRALWVREAADKKSATRVATRFFLETVVKFTHPTDDTKSSVHVSKRVTVPIEHVIIANDRRKFAGAVDPAEEGQAVATLRPEALEWAVPLALPPLGDGQVDAESGFARFRIPKPAARLADCEKDGIDLERDPERRLLTTVRFAAVPDWVGKPEKTKPEPLHGRSIAGFELYELDIDELAPLDTTAGTKLARDNAAWRRARRVARIEQLSREDVQLVPHGNFDWQGWQAHYPGATQRVKVARTADRKGDSKPILAPWYSDRETTAHFPERRPRLRLLPLVPETAVAELMKDGKPHQVVATLSDNTLPELTLHRTVIDGARLDTLFESPSAGTFVLNPKADGSTTFFAADLRNLLLCLGWKPFAEGDERLEKWIEDPTVFDVTLTLVATGTFPATDADGKPVPNVAETGNTRVTLDLRSQVHPILDELVAELALKNRGAANAPSLYRNYAVMPQPVVNLTAKNVEGFMANTAPEADPYGWQVLQTLGLATTIRLYDLAKEAFVPPSELAKRVDAAVQSVAERWREAFGKKYEDLSGQLFAEVFLRPGADRLAGPFEAVITGDLEAENPPNVVLNDEGLAFMQISLRPRPVAVWSYMRQTFGWDDTKNKSLNKDGERLSGLAIRITRRSADVEVARARGGGIIELTTTTPVATLPIGAALRRTTEDDSELELYFRVFNADNGDVPPPADRPLIELVVEYERVDTSTNPVIVTKSIFVPQSGDSPLEIKEDWKHVPEPATNLHPDPFERFEAIAIERWRTAYKVRPLAKASLQAFHEVTTAVGYQFTDDDDAVNAFIPWSDRFLKHNVTRLAESKAGPFLALCAPTKATPWKLAADAEGYITLTFLHSDRWGHARAYAVKPVPRYQELLVGIGVKVQEQGVPLVPETKAGLVNDVGIAVAVSPRTEGIEPPVIMSTRLAPNVVEIIVARHGEESLANSNRALFGRLGVPASLIAFTRAYRTPDWPKRLEAFFQPNDHPPSVELLPPSAATLPVKPEKLTQVTDMDINRLSEDFPNLWKGADIWRIPTIPPHYRLIALASERAGIVVSDVTAVVQEEMPRADLENREGKIFPEAKVTLRLLRKDKERVRLALQHPLVSHAQITPDGDAVFKDAADDDVARWPDPDVLYILSRRTKVGDKFTTEKEDADIRLVPAGPVLNAIPVVVRALGTDYVEADPPVITLDITPKHLFLLESSFRPRAFDVPALPLGKTELGDQKKITLFNDMASLFAAILTPHAMTIDAPPINDENADEYLVRIGKIVTALKEGVRTKLAMRTDEWYRQDLTRQVTAKVAALEAWQATVTPKMQTAPELYKQAPLPIRLSSPWRRLVDFGDLLATGGGLGAVVLGWTELGDLTADPGTWLVVFDFASDIEVNNIAAAGVPPVAKPRGRLYAQLVDGILGSNTAFWLKAVDARSRLTIKGSSAHARGVVERQITVLPACFKKKEGL